MFCIVVVRKLNNCNPVVTKVVELPKHLESDAIKANRYGQKVLTEVRKEITEEFVEFTEADWFFEILEVHSDVDN